jgi:hypothetical protein
VNAVSICLSVRLIEGERFCGKIKANFSVGVAGRYVACGHFSLHYCFVCCGKGLSCRQGFEKGFRMCCLDEVQYVLLLSC